MDHAVAQIIVVLVRGKLGMGSLAPFLEYDELVDALGQIVMGRGDGFVELAEMILDCERILKIVETG